MLKNIPFSILVFLAASVVVLTGGCATTQHTDPAKVSWGDLREGSRLQRYLERRQEELARLEGVATGLERHLTQKSGELNDLQQRLGNVRAKSAASRQNIANLNIEIQKQQTALTDKQAEIKSLKSEMQRLSRETKDQQLLKERIASYEVEIEDLQQEVEVIDRSIDKILTIRARHALEQG